ncbi:MarR family winged helix-turn-helix transcriptional regulator [Thalassococcus sp. S3]|uniref:MarR family winged helix-turn-helix transcriptional regulator n=1 Tax=Thalassococcus sp. S3 TaxID=2017482 RepID=UPI0010243B74|nr:MarR family transcriptional regulator [Thalassococcus sp. S3]QBF33954.1 MarR family transcriptional regulator [Thalassococcus sp. S3]
MAREINHSKMIAELLVHIGRASRSEDAGTDLTAAQWTCLRFFARANPSTRTPSAFASFQATTRGTASQIVKALEKRGLIARKTSPTDGRSTCLELTETGHKALAADPLERLISAVDMLPRTERDAFLKTLSSLVSTLADLRGAQAFGTCGDCTHFTPSGTSGYCACMAAEVAAEDIQKLCASYSGIERGQKGHPDGI